MALPCSEPVCDGALVHGWSLEHAPSPGLRGVLAVQKARLGMLFASTEEAEQMLDSASSLTHGPAAVSAFRSSCNREISS